jgi:hypothetical protein
LQKKKEFEFKDDKEKDDDSKKKKKKKKKVKEDDKKQPETIEALKPKMPFQRSRKRRKSFEAEDLYMDKTKPDDVLIVTDIVKTFGDGKKAVDHVNINFYKDEIFAY